MVDINIREELVQMEKEFAIKVIHVSSNKYIKCKCFNPLYKTGNSKCPLCLGSGRVTTMSMLNTITYNHSGTSNNSSLGNSIIDENIFIFNHKSKINEKDIILIVGFKENSICDLKEIFKVKYVDNVRGDNGRVEYVVANTTKANQLLNSYSKVINNLPTYQNTRLMKGEKLLLGDINGI
jgi:hypothetical protein